MAKAIPTTLSHRNAKESLAVLRVVCILRVVDVCIPLARNEWGKHGRLRAITAQAAGVAPLLWRDGERNTVDRLL